MSTLAMQAADPLLRYYFDIKIDYGFTDDTVSVELNQESHNGLLVEAGVDYTVNNFGTTSFKLYGRGGLEFWDSNRGTDWRASGGVTFQF